MRNLLHRWTPKAALFLGLFLAAAQVAPAQATVTGQRGAEIAPFALTTLIRPDYGQPNNIGYTVGVDYTRFIRSIVQPAIEVRFTSANGSQVNERSFGGGLKLQTTIFGIHPYATALIGQGNVTFLNPTPTHINNSTVYSLGGGAEFTVTSRWKVRADFTDQHWNLNPNTLTPMTFAVGVAYSVPFHNGRSH